MKTHMINFLYNQFSHLLIKFHFHARDLLPTVTLGNKTLGLAPSWNTNNSILKREYIANNHRCSKDKFNFQ